MQPTCEGFQVCREKDSTTNAKCTLLHYIDYIIMVSFNINKKDLLFHQTVCYIINPSKK